MGIKIKWRMKYFSMFSGIGGFELGIERATKSLGWIQQENKERQDSRSIEGKRNRSNEWECVGFSEIDKYAIQTYLKHFPDHKNYGDATKIIPRELPDFDILCGGFPCQSFSIAGKRLGFEDTRGTLFFDIARIVKVKRPQYLFLENVKGLLNHDGGRTFATILATLDELGYNAEWQLFNSKHFGVPQNRERVFIIGHLRGSGGRQVFPIRESNIETKITNGKITNASNREFGFKECSPALLTRDYKEPKIVKCGTLRTHKEGKGFREVKLGLCPTIPARAREDGSGQPVVEVRAVLTPDRLNKRQNGKRFKEGGEEMFTLTGQDQHGVAMKDRIRRLTPTECARLQSFPDKWCNDLSDTQAYKCYGNAVTVNVIEAIIKKMVEVGNVY